MNIWLTFVSFFAAIVSTYGATPQSTSLEGKFELTERKETYLISTKLIEDEATVHFRKIIERAKFDKLSDFHFVTGHPQYKYLVTAEKDGMKFVLFVTSYHLVMESFELISKDTWELGTFSSGKKILKKIASR